MRRDPSGIQYADVSFCPGSQQGASRLLATAVSARVDIYSLTQPNEDGKYKALACNMLTFVMSKDLDTTFALKPSKQLFKFQDPVTALQFR